MPKLSNRSSRRKGVQKPKVQKAFSDILQRGAVFSRRLFNTSVPKMRKRNSGGRKNRGRSTRQEDPNLAAQLRQRFFGRSNEERRERLWDAENEPREVERVLRPRSREEETKRIQEQARKRSQRNYLLFSGTKREDFHVLVAFLNRIESGAYANLRHPDLRKPNISLDYFNGFQNGTIEIVENIRNMYVEAARQYYNELSKKRERENDKI